MDNFDYSLNKDDETPLWVQLRNQIILKIRSGELSPEEKLPTVRGLSQTLGISPSVVNQCYRYLKATGYLEARQGSGVRVRRRNDTIDDADFGKVSKLINDFIDSYTSYGMPLSGVVDAVSYAVASRTLDPDEKYSVMEIYRDILGDDISLTFRTPREGKDEGECKS